MTTIIEESTTQTLPSSRYLHATLSSGKRRATVSVCRSEVYGNYIRVIVQNDSHLTWKGMGKSFRTLPEALAAYKSASIRSMIETAYEMALESLAA